MTRQQLIDRGIVSADEFEEQHSGRMIESLIEMELNARIDNTLALERKRREERNKMLCVCRAPRGEHSPLWDGEKCPNPIDAGPFYLGKKFRELRCQATYGEAQCERECIAGKDMCKEHYAE